MTQSAPGQAIVTTTATSATNSTAVNRFDHFSIAGGQAATLVLPKGTTNLINLVRDPAAINGTVTSKLVSDTGSVGGNLIFVTPGGLVVGSTGTINTGRLIVRGAGSFDGSGAIDASTVATVLAGDPAPLVQLDGTVNAPGGLDVKAQSVSIGASARIATGAAGLLALPNVNRTSLVNLAGVPEGTALVARDGGIAIVAENDVMIAGDAANGALLDARPVNYSTGSTSTGTVQGGIAISGGGAIAVGGTLTAWDGTANRQAGDVTISAASTKTLSSAPEAILDTSFFTGSSASTSIDVSGAITGGTVSITAQSKGSTTPGFGTARIGLGALVAAGQADLLALATKDELALDAFVSLAKASTSVSVGSAASVTAKRDLTLAALSTGASSASANTQPARDNTTLAAAVAYSGLTVDSGIAVDGKLSAGGALSVQADSIADSKVDVRTSTEGTLAIAFGYNDIASHARVDIGASGRLTGGTVAIGASNGQSKGAGFVTRARTFTVGQGKAGGVGALSRQDVSSDVAVAGSVTSAGTLDIDASNAIGLDVTTASASVGTGIVSSAKSILVGASLPSLMQSALLAGQSKLVSRFGADKAPKVPASRDAAAVSVALVNHAAHTSVTGTLTSGGSTSVTSGTVDRIARNLASAAVSATRVDGNTGVKRTIVGSLSWGDYAYDATSDVTGRVTAKSLDVVATTDRPRSLYQLDLPESGGSGDVLKFLKDTVASKIAGDLGITAGFFGSAAGASANSDLPKAPTVAGSINVTVMGGDTRAWIDSGAKLTIGSAVNVLAKTDLSELSLAGPIVPKQLGAGVTSGGAAYGGALDLVLANPDTIAGIDDGVILTRAADSAAISGSVKALSTIDLITLAPLAGNATDGGLIGTFAFNQVSGKTHASIGAASTLDFGAGSLAMSATDALDLWAVGGSLVYASPDGTGGTANPQSIGVSGAMNLVDRDTRTLIGTAADDDPTADPVPSAKGTLTAGSLDATALSKGSVNALSVAGTAQNSTRAVDKTPSWLSGYLKGKLNNAKAALAAATDQSAKSFSERKADALLSRKLAEQAGFSDAVGAGAKPQGSLGIAGSAAINLSLGDTKVSIGAANLRHSSLDAGAGHVTARAVQAIDALALTGGAALAIGTSPLKNVKLLAGAYGLSYSTDAVTTTIDASTITGFGDVNVEAIGNAGRIGAGLSLSADATETPEGFVLAASVSHVYAADLAQAAVTGTTIAGPGAGTGKVSILGYNGLRVGAGAGALGFASSNSVGAALTVIQAASSKASGASVKGGSVTGYADLSVRALNASRVAGIAAAGAVDVGKSGVAAAASISVNQIDLDATAVIDLTGGKGITISGALDVFAGDLDTGLSEPASLAGRGDATLGSGFFDDFDFGETGGKLDGISPATPITPGDLAGGSRILSIAVPITFASGGQVGGTAFSFNQIDNDRTARITGSAGAIRAGSVAARSLDRSSILSLATGVGASAAGTYGLVGSLSLNRITGSTLSQIDGGATPLQIRVASASGTPNLQVAAQGKARIFSLAGAVGSASKAAGALALGINEISRRSTGDAITNSDAGIHAVMSGVALYGIPDIAVSAISDGGVTGYAAAGSFGAKGAAASGASSTNLLSPVVVADVAQIAIPGGTPRNLAISANDTSAISSVAAAAASGGGAGSAGVAVNQIGVRVLASLEQKNLGLRAGDLTVEARSAAGIRTLAAGIAIAEQFGGAGSVAVNTLDTRADALVALDGASLALSGSLGVLASRDMTIETLAGAAVAASAKLAGGASLVVDDVGGGAAALVTGTSAGATISAAGGGAGIAGVRTDGLMKALPGLDALSPESVLGAVRGIPLDGAIVPDTETVKGIAVNASSTQISRTVAMTGAVSTKGAVAGTAVIDTLGGSTEAALIGVDAVAGQARASTAAPDIAVDVRANTISDVISLAGTASLASGGTTGIAAAAPIVSDGFTATTKAHIDGGSVVSQGTVAVDARTVQQATALALSAGIASGGAASLAAVSPRFQANTSAAITNPSQLVALADRGVAISADTTTDAFAGFGSLAAGDTAALAAAVVVATNEDTTSARYTGLLDPVKGLGTVEIATPSFIVDTHGRFAAHLVGASLAAGGEGVGAVGNGLGVSDRSKVLARADGLNYNNAKGLVSIAAQNASRIEAEVGQAGLAGKGLAASLGAIVVLQQGEVSADLARPKVVAGTVAVNADNTTGVDALQLGVAAGAAALGANLTYIGIGKVADTGALFAGGGKTSNDAAASYAGSDGEGNNTNLAAMASGGVSASDALANAQGLGDTSSAASGAHSARSAFAQVNGGASAAAVSARITAALRPGAAASSPEEASVTADSLSIGSNSNLVSRTSNYQLTAGAGAGSATVAILRNAASSEAALGAGVTASGKTLRIAATTGQDGTLLPQGFAGGKAAEANIIGGTIGVGTNAVALAYADASLDTAVSAHSDGEVTFNSASIKASDATDIKLNVIGVALGGQGALNLALARADKQSAVGAGLSGTAKAPLVEIAALGSGQTSAQVTAASGAALFAGNGAVALVSDARAVSSTIAEDAQVGTRALTLSADVAAPPASAGDTAPPVLSAKALGVAVGGLVAVGASVATATSRDTVKAQIGEGAVVGCDVLCLLPKGLDENGKPLADGLTIRASLTGTNTADAFGVAGGALAGANGSLATTTNSSDVTAAIGVDLDGIAGKAAVIGAEALTLLASRELTQSANASGIVGALGLAFGLQLAKAGSSGSVTAAIDNVDGSARGAADLTVSALSHDTNRANSVAGGGAALAGTATQAETRTTSKVVARVAPPAPTDTANTLRAGAVKITADALADYSATTDATLASLVGGSGSISRNRLESSAQVVIGAPRDGALAGANSRIEAGSFTIRANNAVGNADTPAAKARGAGGGVISGAAALIDTAASQTARVDILDGVALRQYGGAIDENSLRTLIDASVSTRARQDVTLDVGGLVELPYGRTQSTYAATTAVNIGSNVLLRGDQAIGIGTTTEQAVIDTAATQVYGLAGAGGASTSISTTVTEAVTVRDGTTIEAMGDVRIGAGSSSDGSRATLASATAQTDVFNNTLLPITTDRGATANSTLTETLTLGAAKIRSARDVTLTALGTGIGASAAGVGHNPYLGLFGLTESGGSSNPVGSGLLVLNGTQITAGFLARRTLSITDGPDPGSWAATATDDDGTASFTSTFTSALGDTASDGDRLGRFGVFTRNVRAADEVEAQIIGLADKIIALGLSVPEDPNPITDPEQQKTARADLEKAASTSSVIAKLAAAYDTRAALAASPGTTDQGVEVAGLFAAGGLATIDAKSISGRDARVVANGNPTVTITNASSRNLLVGQIFAPSKPSGTIAFGGKAGADALASVATVVTSGGGDTAAPQINVITGTQDGPATDLMVYGPISNVGGSFNATVNTGNFVQFGSVQVGDFNVTVPNGLFSVSDPGGDFTQANPINLYYGLQGWSLFANQDGKGPTLSADDAAQMIASYQALSEFGLTGTPNAYQSLRNAASRYIKNIDDGNAADKDPVAVLFANGILFPDKPGKFFLDGSTVWGSCNIRCEATSGDSALNNADSYGHTVYFTASNGVNYPVYAIPKVLFHDVVQTAASLTDAAKAKAAATPGGTITARQVRINAAYVNISGTIIAGPDRIRSLSIEQVDADKIASGKPLQKILDDHGNSYATGNIGVRYVGDANGGYLQVDDVDAGAGGLIDITGRILNTNPAGGGELRVLNGFGQIDITNRSSLPLHLGQLNGGVNTAGVIRLNDVAADGSIEQSIYTDAPGQNVTLQHIVNGVSTVSTLEGTGTVASNPIIYTPRGSAYYVFSDNRDITRTFMQTNGEIKDANGLATTDNYVTPWQYAAGGSQPQGSSGRYVDLAAPGSDAALLIRAIGGADKAATTPFVQWASGSVKSDDVAVYGHDYQDHGHPWTFLIPTRATINVQTAVKATYPIKLSFDDRGYDPSFPDTWGTIRINSGSPVVINGTISQGGGPITIAAPSLVQGSGSIITRSRLYLTALEGDIGSPDRPLVASLAGTTPDSANYSSAFKALFADAYSGSIYLDLTSSTASNGVADGVPIEHLVARDTVSITSPNPLVGGWRYAIDGSGQFPELEANIVAHDIVLNTGSGIGAAGPFQNDPLRKPGLAVVLTHDDSRPDGGLTVTAGGDVSIQSVIDPYERTLSVSDTLRIASITTPGDVTLRGWGSIVAATDVTTIDEAKLDRFLDAAGALQLAPGGAACAGSTNCDENNGRRAKIRQQIRAQAATAYAVLVRTGNGTTVTAASKSYDAQTALGRIGAINQLRKLGVVIGADWAVSLKASANIRAGSALYTLAVNTLRTLDNRLNSEGTGPVMGEQVLAPTKADILRGLTAYVDKTRRPLVTLFGATAPSSSVLRLGTLDAVTAAIPEAGFMAAAAAANAEATATLQAIFDVVPTSAQGIKTAKISESYLGQRTRGAVWSESQLDFAVPSTAFVPVADTQFETRPAVITARNLTMVAGNSIGTFAAPQSYTFTAAGLTYSDPSASDAAKAAERAKVASYLASSGPGDLVTTVTRANPGNPQSQITSVTFTTRRDIPLQLDVSGTVNAFAATNPATLASNGAGSTADAVNGDIFLSNLQTLTIGSIISQKVQGANEARGDCNVSAALGAAGCDSRIRLQGRSIAGVTSGAIPFNPGTLLSDPGGRAVIVGGRVRLEASQGDITSTDGSRVVIDARALETLRADGDIKLEKRPAVAITGADPDTLGDYAYPAELILGDVFAGQTFDLVNPAGAIVNTGTVVVGKPTP